MGRRFRASATPSRSSAAALLALLAALVAAAAPAPADGQATSRPRVAEVAFEGNENFSSDSLAAAIVTRESRCRSDIYLPFCWFGADFAIRDAYLPRRELPRDQLRLRVWYQRRGFREAEVDTAMAETDDGVRITFRIEEGRPVRVDSIRFFGADAVDLPRLVSDLPLETGDRLSTLELDASRDTLIRRLANEGYAQADVLRSYFIPSDAPYTAEVTYDIAPGPRSRYGHISISGHEELSEGTVLRTLQFEDGDLYRAGELAEAQGRLFGLEIIRSASVTPLFGEGPDSVIPVRVEIREGDAHRVRTGTGWTSLECLEVDTRWVSRNFQGGGRRLQLRGRVSNVGTRQFGDVLCPASADGAFAELTWLLSADFSQPWIFSTRNSFRASLFGERQTLPDLFIREAVGLDLALTRAIGPRTPLTVSWTPELSRLDAAELLFCTSFLICTPRDVAVLQGANWLAPVGLSFNRNMTDNVLNPTDGYTLVANLEHAGSWTGSDFRYDRAIAEATWYKRVTRGGLVVATDLRLGWVGSGVFEELVRAEEEVDIVHPQKRFYSGGANSVRGFAQNRLGPRVLTTDVRDLLVAGCAPTAVQDRSCDASVVEETVLDPRPTGGTRLVEGSLELRQRVSTSFQLAAFADFGQLWQNGVDNASLEVTPGVGVRYLSPIGPLRVDLAYRFRGGEDLPVVTTQLADYDPTVHDPGDRIRIGDETLPYVSTNELAILEPRVFFGDTEPWSFRRLQLHFSIGQAF